MKKTTIFGLTASQFVELMCILDKNKASLNEVILFGSRAKGDYKPASDIDLAVDYKANTISLDQQFEESTLPFMVDIVDIKLCRDKKIYQHVLSDGIMLIKNHLEEKNWMSLALLNEKLDDFNSALMRLEEAIEKDIYKDDMYLDATIQRFEFCYELCWKLMKAYLKYVGIDVNSPRSAFREAFKEGLISEVSIWLKMLDKRNLTSHTYHEDMAKDVYYAVKDDFYDLLEGFRDKISILVKELLK